MLPISCRRCRRRDSCRVLIALCLLLAPAHAGKRLLPNLSPRGSRAPVEAAQRLAKAKLEAAQARVRAAEEELASVQRARAAEELTQGASEAAASGAAAARDRLQNFVASGEAREVGLSIQAWAAVLGDGVVKAVRPAATLEGPVIDAEAEADNDAELPPPPPSSFAERLRVAMRGSRGAAEEGEVPGWVRSVGGGVEKLGAEVQLRKISDLEARLDALADADTAPAPGQRQAATSASPPPSSTPQPAQTPAAPPAAPSALAAGLVPLALAAAVLFSAGGGGPTLPDLSSLPLSSWVGEGVRGVEQRETAEKLDKLAEKQQALSEALRRSLGADSSEGGAAPALEPLELPPRDLPPAPAEAPASVARQASPLPEGSPTPAEARGTSETLPRDLAPPPPLQRPPRASAPTRSLPAGASRGRRRHRRLHRLGGGEGDRGAAAGAGAAVAARGGRGR